MRVVFVILVTLIGVCLGAALGVYIPWQMAQNYVASGGDVTAAGAYSFLPIITLPTGALVGGGGGLFIALKTNVFRKRKGASQSPQTEGTSARF